MWLAIDSGNSRIKWAVIDGGRVLAHHSAPKTAVARLKKIAAGADDAWIAHVGDDAQRRRLDDALSGCQKRRFLKSRRQGGDVHNAYRPPTALGVDRWLCLLAARPLQRSVVIVSAGTAITVDALSADGVFRGGLILPGLSAMGAALANTTPLPAVAAASVSDAVPDCTADAVAGGAVLAAVGAVVQFRRRYAAGAQLLITGGDADILRARLPTAKHLPHLVLRGIMRLRETTCKH